MSLSAALGSGAGFVHERKGQFTTACRVVIDYFLSQVDSCAFASDETVQQLLKEMEDSFTARFGRGLVVINFNQHPDNFIRSERRQKARIGSPKGGFFSQDTPF